MTTRRERAKPQKPRQNKQLEAMQTEAEEPEIKVNQRKEKLADFLIDVAKYVFTGVIISSLFDDLTDKTMLYLVGMFIVIITLWIGLILTNKRKDN